MGSEEFLVLWIVMAAMGSTNFKLCQFVESSLNLCDFLEFSLFFNQILISRSLREKFDQNDLPGCASEVSREPLSGGSRCVGQPLLQFSVLFGALTIELCNVWDCLTWTKIHLVSRSIACTT